MNLRGMITITILQSLKTKSLKDQRRKEATTQGKIVAIINGGEDIA